MRPFVGAVVMVGFTVGVLVDLGAHWLTFGSGGVALALVLIVLFDHPVASEFTAEGVVRRSVARHHRIAWEDVTQLRRHRMGLVRSADTARGGGLIARMGRRSVTLVDTMESADENRRLRELLGDHADDLGLTEMRPPPEGRAPTWLYRRERWRPESARRR